MAYVFDPETLQNVARSVIDLPIDEKVVRLHAELSRRYPGRIQREITWVFNNAGGAMGQMCVLHASLTEYLIVFGSPIGTEGHSGRFAADDYFIILEGEQWAYAEGDLDRRVFRPGDMHHLPRFTARGYRMPDKCYALEYARGLIPLMLPFGFADTFTSTLDFVPLARTVGIYTKAVLGNMLRPRTAPAVEAEPSSAHAQSNGAANHGSNGARAGTHS